MGTNFRPWIISDKSRLEMTFDTGPYRIPGTFRAFKGFRATYTFHNEGRCLHVCANGECRCRVLFLQQKALRNPQEKSSRTEGGGGWEGGVKMVYLKKNNLGDLIPYSHVNCMTMQQKLEHMQPIALIHEPSNNFL